MDVNNVSQDIRSVGLIGHPGSGVSELINRILENDQTPIPVIKIEDPVLEFIWIE
jgi:predicted GTPase